VNHQHDEVTLQQHRR